MWIGGIYEINNGKVLCHVFAGGQLIATFEPQCNAGLSKVLGKQPWYLASTKVLSWPFKQGRGQWTVFGGTWAGILGLCLVAGRGTRLKRYEWRRALRPVCLFRQAVTVTFISAFLFGSVGNVDATTPTYTPVFYYYHPDPLGSSNILTDRSGNVVQHYEYATFGQTSYQDNTSAFPVSNRYTGQIADDETGGFRRSRYGGLERTQAGAISWRGLIICCAWRDWGRRHERPPGTGTKARRETNARPSARPQVDFRPCW